jgi:hypothetical protein
VGSQGGKVTLESTHGRAGGADDDDGIGGYGTHGISFC